LAICGQHVSVRLIFPEALSTVIKLLFACNAMESLVFENEVKGVANLLFFLNSLIVCFLQHD